jgi:hypothetical protein
MTARPRSPRLTPLLFVTTLIAASGACSFVESWDAYTGGVRAAPDASNPDAASPDAAFGQFEIVATNQIGTQSMQADANGVFWLTVGATLDAGAQPLGTVMGLLTTGRSTPRTLATAAGIHDLTQNANALYWGGCRVPTGPICNGDLYSINKDGSGLAQAEWDYYAIGMGVADGPTAYVLDPYGRLTFGPKEGPPTRVTDKGDGTLIAAGPTAVYVVYPRDEAIVAYDRKAMSAGFIVFAAQQNAPAAIASDGAALYWINDKAGEVARLAFDHPGETPLVIASAQPSLSAVAVDASFVYWTNKDGSLRFAPKTGGPSTTIATGLSNPVAVAANDTGVFVANGGDATIVRIPRR